MSLVRLPAIRTTTYAIKSGQFTGTTYDLALEHSLSEHYFVMVTPGALAGATASDLLVGVTGDEDGFGDLVATGANTLRLARATSSVNWTGTVIVVESLTSHDTGGFTLLDVRRTAIPAATATAVQEVPQAITGGIDRVALFGGYRGGGVVAASSTTHAYTGNVRVVSMGSAAMRVERYAESGVVAATVTTYVVQFGSSWKVQELAIGSTKGSATPAAGDWENASLAEAVDAGTTWLWWSARTDGVTSATWWGAVAVAVGTGVAAPSGSTSTVSLTTGKSGTVTQASVWAFTHPDLVVIRRALQMTLPSGFTDSNALVGSSIWMSSPESLDEYVDDVTAAEHHTGHRIGFTVEAGTDDSTTTMEQCFTSQTIEIDGGIRSRRSTGGTVTIWLAMLGIADFGGIRGDEDTLPSIRTTQYKVEIPNGDSQVLVDLKKPLEPNYFAMLHGSREDDEADPDSGLAMIIADPFDVGEPSVVPGTISAPTSATEIGIGRNGSTGVWRGTLTIVESLRDHDRSGFTLLGVEDVVSAASADGSSEFQQTTHTRSSSSSWGDDLDRVVAFGGKCSGGYSIDATPGTTAQLNTASFIMVPTGSSTLVVTRARASSGSGADVTCRTYMVKFGTEWTVRRALSTGELTTSWKQAVDFGENFTTANTWVMLDAATYGDLTGSRAPSALAVHVGNGTTTSSIASTLAVKAGATVRSFLQGVALSHPQLSVSWAAFSGTPGGLVSVSEPVGDDCFTQFRTEPMVGSAVRGTALTGRRFSSLWAINNSAVDGDFTSSCQSVRYATRTQVAVDASSGASATTSSGWLEQVDMGAVAEAVVSSVRDRDGAAVSSFFVFPDPAYLGSNNVVDVTDQHGMYPGLVVPGNGNRGTANAALSGWPADDAEDVGVRVTRSGSVDSVAGYVVKRASDPLWMGMNSIFHVSDHVTAHPNHRMPGGTVVYSGKLQKIFVVQPRLEVLANTSSDVGIGVHDREDGSSWGSLASTATFHAMDAAVDTGGTADISEYKCAAVDACELDDGSILFVVERDPSDPDFAVYKSEDGFVSAPALVADRVRSSTGALNLGLQVLSPDGIITAPPNTWAFPAGGYTRIASSGPFVRVTRIWKNSLDASNPSNDVEPYVYPTDSNIRNVVETFVSVDRGVSWKRLEGEVQLAAFDLAPPNGNHRLQPGGDHYDMVALGDEAGTMMMFRIAYIGVGTWGLQFASASRDGEWSDFETIETFTASSVVEDVVQKHDPRAMCAVTTPSHVFVFIWSDDASENDVSGTVVWPHWLKVFGAPIALATLESAWSDYGNIAPPMQSMTVFPYRPKATWAGNRIVIHSGLVEEGEDEGSLLLRAGDMTISLGGLSTRPWNWTREDDHAAHQFFGNAVISTLTWRPYLGNPEDAASFSSISFGTSVATNWTPERYLMTVTGEGANYVVYQKSGWTQSHGENWGENGLGDFAVRAMKTGTTFEVDLTATPTASTVDKALGFRVTGYDFDFIFSVTDAEWKLFDALTDTAVGTTLGSDFAAGRVRAHVIINAARTAYRVTLLYGVSGMSENDEWEALGSYNVSRGSVSAGDRYKIRVGVLASTVGEPSTVLCSLRGITISRYTGAGQGEAGVSVTLPDSFIGIPMYRTPTLSLGGLWLRWGGFGAAVGDTFTTQMSYQNGKDALSYPSPSIPLESSSTGEWSVTLRAASEGHFTLDAIVLLNTVDPTASFLMSNDLDDFEESGSPPVSVSLDASILPAVRVIAVKTSSFKLARIDGEPMPAKGELVGAYIKVHDGVFKPALRILSNEADGWITHEGLSSTSSLLIQVGQTATVFGDRMAFRFGSVRRFRYMKIIFPANTTRGSVLKGRHRIGAIVPGVAFDFAPDLDWTSTTNVSRPTSVIEGETGRTIRRVLGPVRRTYSSMVVGTIDGFRERMLALHHELSSSGLKPGVLVLDDRVCNRATGRAKHHVILYGSLTPNEELANAAWNLQENEWVQVGDVGVNFTEEV